MIAIPRGTQHDQLLQELNHSIKHPWGRLVLANDYSQPELLHLAVNCLQLVNPKTTSACLVLCTQMLKGLVREDCGFYHFAREWIRAYGVGDGAATTRLRRALLHQLQGVLGPRCQEIELARLAATGERVPASAQANHRCWSVAGHGRVGGAEALRRARERAPRTRKATAGEEARAGH